MATSETGKCVSAGDRRQELLDGVLSAAKSCQNKFGKRTELATDSNEEIKILCTKLEMIFLHGLKSASSSLGLAVLKNVKDLVSGTTESGSGGVWRIVRTILNRHEFDRFSGLKNVTTDTGRGRAWLRSALNEQSLEKYFYMLLGDEIRLREFYEDWAFFRDKDRSSLLPSIASSLCSIRFALKLDSPDINGEEALGLGSSLSSFLPSSLNLKQSQEPSEIFVNQSVATEVPSEVVIDTSKMRTKKKKKAKGSVVTINEKISDNSLREPSALASQNPVTLTSPLSQFHAKEATEAETEKLTAKLNNLLQVKTPEKVEIHSDEENVKFTYDSVDLQKQNPFLKDEDTELLVDSPPTPTNKGPVKDSLTPIANKGIGGLFPVTTRSVLLSEDPNVSGDDSTSNKSMRLDEVDYAVPAPSGSPAQNNDVNDKASFSLLSVTSGDSVSSNSSIKQNDLKQALLSVMEKKDDLEDQVKALKRLLDQEISHVAESKQELNDIKQIHKEKQEKTEARVSVLSRENELLKHQLKKYVGAVQKLRDGPHAYETLAQLEGASKELEGSRYIDYHFEASEYEKKLIQVAEMHGELLEFSENLQKSLQTKEAVISRLRNELILLRGPLPDDEDRFTDDSASICSSFTDTGSIGSARVLVNIWIPSVFMTGSGSSRHHVYQVSRNYYVNIHQILFYCRFTSVSETLSGMFSNVTVNFISCIIR